MKRDGVIEGFIDEGFKKCHLVIMRVRMEVVVRNGTGLVLTYGRCGAATDELEYYVGNTSEHSESPAHLTRRGEGVREGQKQTTAALPQQHRQSIHRTHT